jgi:hypothetical protein
MIELMAFGKGCLIDCPPPPPAEALLVLSLAIFVIPFVVFFVGVWLTEWWDSRP